MVPIFTGNKIHIKLDRGGYGNDESDESVSDYDEGNKSDYDKENKSDCDERNNSKDLHYYTNSKGFTFFDIVACILRSYAKRFGKNYCDNLHLNRFIVHDNGDIEPRTDS